MKKITFKTLKTGRINAYRGNRVLIKGGKFDDMFDVRDDVAARLMQERLGEFSHLEMAFEIQLAGYAEKGVKIYSEDCWQNADECYPEGTCRNAIAAMDTAEGYYEDATR
jgi:hypothetical protein